MRKLQTSDVFAALRVIKAANLREELKPMLKRVAEKSAEEKSDVQDIGIDGILSMVGLLSEAKAEKAMYEVLAGPFEMKASEVAALDIVTLADNIQTLAQENDLKVFFGYLSNILGKK